MLRLYLTKVVEAIQKYRIFLLLQEGSGWARGRQSMGRVRGINEWPRQGVKEII